MEDDTMFAIVLLAVIGFLFLPVMILLAVNIGVFVGHGALLPWDKYVEMMPMLLRLGIVGAVGMPILAVLYN
jgi:hypothetical protein